MPVKEEPVAHPELILVRHSPLVHWWPVWVVGYIMYGLTWWYGEPLTVGGEAVKFHPGSSLRVLFFLVLFLVIVVSNISVRGYASGIVVMGIITDTVILAYFGWWGAILGWFGDLNVYLNQGAYFWFSTLMLLVWALSVFVLDRFTYWKVTAGQLTRVSFLGAGSRSYDTQGMVFEKHRDDLFKHWVLGLGSGDLRIQTYGAPCDERDLTVKTHADASRCRVVLALDPMQAKCRQRKATITRRTARLETVCSLMRTGRPTATLRRVRPRRSISPLRM